MNSAIDVVTRRLTEVTGYTPPREGADWRCPAHDDRRPSLSVSNGNGRVLVHCQVGCSVDAVVGALKLTTADLFDERREPIERPQIVARYDYVDEAGELLFQVLRKHLPDGKKTFLQRRPDGNGGWVYRLGDARRVLYRLPKVLDGVARGYSIFIAEGEKDVHALEAVGEVATCNPGGAGKWRAEYAEVLAGAQEVFIVADRDADGKGLRHARDIERSLRGRVAALHVVQAVVGKDAADHLGAAAGRSRSSS